jgi:hypothetical protein
MSDPFVKSDCDDLDDCENLDHKEHLVQTEQATVIAARLRFEFEQSQQQQKSHHNRLLAVLPPPPGDLRSVRHGW